MPVPAASVPSRPCSLTRSTLPAATCDTDRVSDPDPDADPVPEDADDFDHGDAFVGGADVVDVEIVHAATPKDTAMPQAASPIALNLTAPPPYSGAHLA
jgi:hypothetical protein